VSDDFERQAALDVLSQAPVGYVAVVTPLGPYVVPLSFAHDGQRIYWHGREGELSTTLGEGAAACLVAAVDEELQLGESPCDDAFAYRSVMVRGPARRLQEWAQKLFALQLVTLKYDPMRRRAPMSEDVLERTLVYGLDMKEISYKEVPRR
jgi:uncharacterized protein